MNKISKIIKKIDDWAPAITFVVFMGLLLYAIYVIRCPAWGGF